MVVETPSAATLNVRRPVTGSTADAVCLAFTVHRLPLAATKCRGLRARHSDLYETSMPFPVFLFLL
jgi:hypothetical protein